ILFVCNHNRMTRPQKRRSTPLARALKTRGLTMAELANILGITTGALRNIACNHVTSLRTRQAITNIIGNQIWRGASVTKRTFILREGTEIEFVDDPDTARDFEREFPGKTRRRGARIKITGAVCGDF